MQNEVVLSNYLRRIVASHVMNQKVELRADLPFKSVSPPLLVSTWLNLRS